MQGKAHRPGLCNCHDCREQFTVTVGAVFERSKIPLNVWLQAVYLLCSSKKGTSSKQLERVLGVTYKTAWFMSHRIREAMKQGPSGLLGGGGIIVEADETYWARKRACRRSAVTGTSTRCLRLWSAAERFAPSTLQSTTATTINAVPAREHREGFKPPHGRRDQ